jgi:hypothetical protein
VCKTSTLATYLDLGSMALTGYFPFIHEEVPSQPLTLSRCSNCGLSQLHHELPISDLYGPGYGYESHLNSSMRNHLKGTALNLERFQDLKKGDTVIDIASNDGTLLSGYENREVIKIGIDPLINSLNDFYPDNTKKIEGFFGSKVADTLDGLKAKIITSFSVFYDLDNPIDFVQGISNLLDDKGIWVLEQSYFWDMINTLGFDMICHEHLLYLRLIDIQNLIEKCGLEIFRVNRNEVNGGSIQIFVQKKNGSRPRESTVDWLISVERDLDLEWETIYSAFRVNVELFRSSLSQLIIGLVDEGLEVIGLGASTKGNVLLQYCGLSSKIISKIGEINPKKFGRVTPGTRIPIVSEKDAFSGEASKIALVLPWHFRQSVINSVQAQNYQLEGFLLPLPNDPKLILPTF